MSSKRADFIARRQGKPNGQTLILLVIGAGLMLIAVAAFLSIPKAQAEVVSAGASAIPMAVNFPAPEVKLTDLQGNPVALSDYQGQVVLYNAWATWCPPCKEEMPTLEAFYQEYKDSGLVIVAIEDGEPASEVADFVKNYQLTFPVWPDPKWVATTAFKSDSLPTSFVIDRTGVVRLTWTGAISRAMLEKYVTPMLGQ